MTILLENEILRVTPTGKFIWHEDADRMIEEGDFSHSPAMPFILKALRKREWVGLTRLELDIATLGLEDLSDCYKAIEAKLKEKNCVL